MQNKTVIIMVLIILTMAFIAGIDYLMNPTQPQPAEQISCAHCVDFNG
jgi:hypothetical protein